MNPKLTEKKWMEDFKDFVSSEGTPIPEYVSKNILGRIHKAMNPSSWFVFAKLFGIHLVVGTLSLGVCNQFGLNPFNTNFSLSDYFMKLGHSACMTFCGFLFVGLSVSLAAVILNNEEFRTLRRNSLLQVFVLGLFSLAVFIAAGAEIFFTIGLFWLIGAMIGGMLPVVIFNSRLKLN